MGGIECSVTEDPFHRLYVGVNWGTDERITQSEGSLQTQTCIESLNLISGTSLKVSRVLVLYLFSKVTMDARTDTQRGEAKWM